MPPQPTEPIDLVDLKLLPAWVKETPDAQQYAHYEGDDGGRRQSGAGRDRRSGRPQGRDGGNRDRGPKRPPSKPGGRDDRRPRRPQDRQGRPDRGGRPDRPRVDRPVAPAKPPPEIAVRFVPHLAASESIAAQIKVEPLAYSLFSLARLFLQKPERYDVQLGTKPESPFFQLGENGAISLDRQFLENSAFRLAQQDFYKIDITQSDPIKGNFTSVARDRLSGTLLGPTNHHAYQPRLRSLYEQRFSRRMSFAEYQRQIEIVTDPALVEQWKEEARTVTTFSTLREEPPVTFPNAAEAERHFRQHYLPSLVGTISEKNIDGVTSRTLGDRVLRRIIEDAWSAQTRSPSQMMQELANRFRETGLHIFRHRKGMLFVSPIRVRPFTHDETGVSPHVRAILDAVSADSRINRKDLAEKLLAGLPAEEAETRKLGLASDLRWLISEGYLIEFNDGSLDLPRVKAKKEEPAPAIEETQSKDGVVAAVVSTAEPTEQAVAPTTGSTIAEAEIGGS